MEIKRINTTCKFYPCHKTIEDCSFCYCPFYPCENLKRGKYLENGYWDCSKCTWIHKKSTVDKICKFLKENWKDE